MQTDFRFTAKVLTYEDGCHSLIRSSYYMGITSFAVLSFCSRTSRVMAADDKSSSSSMERTTETPVTLAASPSHLTHFKPLSPEQDEPPLRSAYSSFVNLFRFSNKGEHFRVHALTSLNAFYVCVQKG